MTARRILLFSLIFTFIISCKQERKPTVEQLPDPLEAGWKGHSVCEVMQENEELRVLKCTFPPNVGHEKHTHQPHYGYTLAGGKFRITSEEGTKEVEVPTGSDWHKKEESTHEVLNIGETTAVFLIVEYR